MSELPTMRPGGAVFENADDRLRHEVFCQTKESFLEQRIPVRHQRKGRRVVGGK